jgi:hypothetical protein
MRSCLIQLLVTLAFIFALVWFGLPFGAGWLATNALNAAGFTGTDTKVSVAADLPPRILLGHADTVRLTSSQVSVGDLHAGAIDVTLGNVELFDRKVGTVAGTLTGVRVPAINGALITAQTVAIAGAGTDATASLTVANAQLEGLATSQLKAAGLNATSVKLQAPDRVVVKGGGVSRTGHLVVKGGALQVVLTGATPATVILLDSGSGNPFQFTSVSVGTSVVTLVGTIDLQSLLGL